MNKNEIIDAVVACWDRDGVVSGGVYVDRFVALAKRLPAYKDVVVPAADETSHPVPEPVVAAPVEAPLEPVVVEPAVVEAPVEPVVTE
jgi:hypothetical protein